MELIGGGVGKNGGMDGSCVGGVSVGGASVGGVSVGGASVGGAGEFVTTGGSDSKPLELGVGEALGTVLGTALGTVLGTALGVPGAGEAVATPPKMWSEPPLQVLGMPSSVLANQPTSVLKQLGPAIFPLLRQKVFCTIFSLTI